jgi:hypothetical protein
MRAREFIKPQIAEQQVDEILPAVAALGTGAMAAGRVIGQGAMAAGRAIGQGAMAAGRMAAQAGSKIGQVAGKVGQAAGKVGQQMGKANTLDLGKDIANSLKGKASQQAQVTPQNVTPDEANQVQQNIATAQPNATPGQIGNLVTQYKQGKVDDQGNPIAQQPAIQQPNSTAMPNTVAKALDSKTNQAMSAAAKSALPAGTTISNDKLGPLQVQPNDPSVPDKEKGVTVKVKNDPTLPKFTIKNKDLAQGSQKIQKDLGGAI